MSATLCVHIKCQSGKRDDVKTLWEKQVKEHAANNSAVSMSVYSFDSQDPDAITLFEVLDDASILTTLYQEAWFKKYIAEMGALLAEPPSIRVGTPVWIKGQ